MIGRRVATSGGGALIGGTGWEGRPLLVSTRVPGEVGVGAAVGTLRTEEGTSGRGANSATRASISRRRRPQALARTASWFSVVRCGRSSRTEVRDIAPEARWSRITGKLRHARAAWVRLQARPREAGPPAGSNRRANRR